MAQGAEGKFTQPDAQHHPDLFLWTDTCNVYVVRDGDSALLIDLGDGSVLDHLGQIGVKTVEWVLFTQHHREQTQGAPKLAGSPAKIAGPQAERALFEQPASFRKMKVRLSDSFTVHGASYVRPPIHPIKLDRAFQTMDTFTWRGREFRCVDTRGNSPGAMSYFLQQNGRWIGFTGDVMLDGAKMHTWFDTEWDYGFAAGVWALANSVGQVAGYDCAWLFPAQGKPVSAPAKQLEDYRQKLFRLERLLVRGYPVNSFASAIQDDVSRPTAVPNVWQVSPHIYKFRGPNFFPNFYIIIADSGRALVVDCGLLSTNFLDTAIEGMKAKLGLKQIDAMIPTHMHGDHFLQGPHLREKWGAQLWALERMAAVCERPHHFDYSAPIQAYGIGVDGVKFDRLFKDGETIDWEGYKITIDWMPGQTEFALCVTAMIDGKRVAFTGDNIFGNPRDEEQNGHEAMVAHNSAVLEEGYIFGAEYLARLKPDILLGGHSYVMDQPTAFIERYRKWAYAMRDMFKEMSSEPNYEFWFDPFWVRAEPYRSEVTVGGSRDLQLHLRNFAEGDQRFQIRITTPPGLRAEPAQIDANLSGKTRKTVTFTLTAESTAVKAVQLIAFDITRDGKHLGQIFDAIVEVRDAP